jgi:hypothetical protein
MNTPPLGSDINRTKCVTGVLRRIVGTSVLKDSLLDLSRLAGFFIGGF